MFVFVEWEYLFGWWFTHECQNSKDGARNTPEPTQFSLDT